MLVTLVVLGAIAMAVAGIYDDPQSRKDNMGPE